MVFGFGLFGFVLVGNINVRASRWWSAKRSRTHSKKVGWGGGKRRKEYAFIHIYGITQSRDCLSALFLRVCVSVCEFVCLFGLFVDLRFAGVASRVCVCVGARATHGDDLFIERWAAPLDGAPPSVKCFLLAKNWQFGNLENLIWEIFISVFIRRQLCARHSVGVSLLFRHCTCTGDLRFEYTRSTGYFMARWRHWGKIHQGSRFSAWFPLSISVHLSFAPPPFSPVTYSPHQLCPFYVCRLDQVNSRCWMNEKRTRKSPVIKA